MRYGILSLLLSPCCHRSRPAPPTPVSAVMADPAAVRLDGPKAVYSLLIHGQTAGGGPST